jgi:membrane-associated protease RseP (regulator of RpoE activity)
VKIALGVDHGVLVTEVVEDSPAEEAGIEMGDIILELDGERIEDTEDLIYLVKKRPEKEVKLVLLRKGKRKEIKVKLGEKPSKLWKRGIKIEAPEGEFKIYPMWENWEEWEKIWKESMKKMEEKMREYERMMKKFEKKMEERLKKIEESLKKIEKRV